MTQTSTGITACNAAVWLDTLAGTLTDISGSSNKVSLEFNQEIGSARTFQSKWPRRFECGKDATFNVDVIYTTATGEGFDILKNWFFADNPGSRSAKFYFPDKDVGSDVFSCEVKLESFSWDGEAGSGDPVMVSAVLLPDGAVTHSVSAT